MNKLDVKALGLTLGIVWGGGMFLLGLTALLGGWGTQWVRAMGSLYIGYEPTVVGSIIGGAWGFVDAGIGGLLIAFIYNKLAK